MSKGVNAHRNSFGFMRLLFASLVIVAHSPQILDGGTGREPLKALFGTITFGDLAVDFFFIISGFLIVGSFLSSRSVWSYLTKRVLRIYPAFVVAYLLSLFVVGALSGGAPFQMSLGEYLRALVRMLILVNPDLPGAFSTLPNGTLNSPMWTVSYEFRCYLLVPLLGWIGLLRHRTWLLGITATAMVAQAALVWSGHTLTWGPLGAVDGVEALLLDPGALLRLLVMFLAGACFRLFRDRIRFDGRAAGVSLVAALLLLFVEPLAEVGLATFGAYAMFWLAFTEKAGILRRINSDWDISYGVYLYGWPIGALLALYVVGIGPTALAIYTWPLALVAGAASWFLLEERFMKLKARRLAVTERSAIESPQKEPEPA